MKEEGPDLQMTNGNEGNKSLINKMEVSGPESPEFTCETCSKVFGNLDQFMDHRNFECIPGKYR